MRTDKTPEANREHGGPQFAKAMEQLNMIVVEALKYGYFNGTITIETTTRNRREMFIMVGKIHKFTIPLDELPR